MDLGAIYKYKSVVSLLDLKRFELSGGQFAVTQFKRTPVNFSTGRSFEHDLYYSTGGGSGVMLTERLSSRTIEPVCTMDLKRR